MNIIDCNFDYATQILEIFNDAIKNSTALYDYDVWTIKTMETWFELKNQHNFPVIGVVNDDGTLMGFGSYGLFRMRPAYKYTVENSVYVHKEFRGRGVGKILLKEIIDRAMLQNIHCIVGVIDASNTASIELHKSFGFEFSGTIKQVGFKFENWLDASFYQLLLPTPTQPVDGNAR